MPMIATDTHVLRIQLAGDLNKTIKDTCDAQGVAGRRLAASFEFHNQLVLIFQAAPA